MQTESEEETGDKAVMLVKEKLLHVTEKEGKYIADGGAEVEKKSINSFYSFITFVCFSLFSLSILSVPLLSSSFISRPFPPCTVNRSHDRGDPACT